MVNPLANVRRGTLTGLVLDAGDASSLEQVEILLNGRLAAVTASDGTCEATVIASGLAAVQTRYAGYGAVTELKDIIADESASINLWLT